MTLFNNQTNSFYFFLNFLQQDESLIADESLIQIEEINTDNDTSLSDNIYVIKSEPLKEKQFQQQIPSIKAIANTPLSDSARPSSATSDDRITSTILSSATTGSASITIIQDKTLEQLKQEIKELEDKNINLKKEMEKFYEKDDVFMASLRRQNEENGNFIKLLQSDIQTLTNER